MLSACLNRVKEIVSSIQSLQRHNPETLFRDWPRCFAISIQNSCDLFHGPQWEKREQQYMELTKRYTEAELNKFADMFACLVSAFESDPFQDYLGTIYMELFGGTKQLGQCFTPMNICRVCAETTIGDDIPDEPRTIADECCGGGAMLIAACEHYRNHGINYQRNLIIAAADLDSLCVHMTYIQLSLLGARATVYHMDSLSRQTYACFVTPMEMIRPVFS